MNSYFLYLLFFIIVIALVYILLSKYRKCVKSSPFYTSNIENDTNDNQYYRKVLHTNPKMQLVLMNLKPGEEIGVETHPNTSQFIRVESGRGTAILNGNQSALSDGSAVIVPPGVQHNIIAASDRPLKLYTIYTPPEHAPSTIQANKPV